MPYVAKNDGCASSAELIDYKYAISGNILPRRWAVSHPGEQGERSWGSSVRAVFYPVRAMFYPMCDVYFPVRAGFPCVLDFFPMCAVFFPTNAVFFPVCAVFFPVLLWPLHQRLLCRQWSNTRSKPRHLLMKPLHDTLHTTRCQDKDLGHSTDLFLHLYLQARCLS